MANPIRYSDFFEGSDRELILQAIRDFKDLKTSVVEFNNSVTGAQTTKLEDGMRALSGEIQQVAKAARDLNITNEQGQKALQAQLSTIEKLRAENEALRKSKEGAKQAEVGLAGSVDGLTAKLKEQIKAYRAIDQSTESGYMQGQRQAAAIRITRGEINELNKATQDTSKMFRYAEGSYNALDQQTKALIRDLKQLGDIDGVNKEKAAALSKQIFDNTERLKQYDAQINQNFRNVGNYKSAFNAIGGSINQLTRELPAFTNSVQTGFLAISNNLPILADALTNAAAKNKAMRAEGQATVPVWKQLVSGIFSWGTALSVGITLLTVYGKQFVDFIGNLFSGAKAIDYLKIKQETLNSVMADANKSAGEEISRLQLLYRAATDVTKPMQDRLAAVQALKSEFPDYFAQLSNEVILNGKAESSYKALYNAILATARVKAAQDKLGKLSSEKLDVEEQKQKIENATSAEISRVKPVSGKNFLGDKVLSEKSIQERFDYDVRVIQERRDKALADQQKKLDVIAAKEKFLVDFVGAQNLVGLGGPGGGKGANAAADSLEGLNKKLGELKAQYGALSPAAANYAAQSKGLVKDIKDTELAIKKLQDAISIKPDNSGKKKEHELEQAVKKQDELIQASAKYRIAVAEQEFSQSAKTVNDEIALETKRRDIIVETTGLRLKLYKKDSKEYKDILAEQIKAETDFANKTVQIRDKDAQARTNLLLKAAETDFSKTKKGWTDEAAYEEKRLEILRAGFDERMALYSKDSDEYKSLLADKTQAEAAAQERIRKIREQQEKGQKEVDDSSSDLTRTIITGNIKKDVANRKISPEEADRQIHLNRVAQIQDEIDAKQRQLDAAKQGDADYYQYLKELNDLKKGLVDENTQYEIDQAQKVLEKKKEFQQAAFDFVSTTSGQLFDLGRELNQHNIDELTAQKDKELEVAGNNAQARKKIEENYQKELLKLKRKQAIYDKVQALFNIAINTAQGVSAALASPFTAPFMIPFIIATGAIEAAVVLAKPLPTAATGKKRGKPGGDYLVNEEGWELIQDEHGRYRIANGGKKGITKVSTTDRVFTHKESERLVQQGINTEDAVAYMRSLLSGTRVVMQYEQGKEERIFSAFARSQMDEAAVGRAMKEAVRELPISTLVVDDKGARQYARTLSGKIEDQNKRNSMFGNG